MAELSRRTFLQAAGAGALSTRLLHAAESADARQSLGQEQAAQKPNLLFMVVDNPGYGELGVYGGGATRGAPTPRIDKLANEGLRLTNMNMEAQCTPSRSSILTGRYAIRSGTDSVPFGGVADGLTQWEVTMAESLSAAGYATALHGKWHLGSQHGRLPNDQGCDEWYGIPVRPTRRCGPRLPATRQR
jgi:arylsulfatase